MKYLLSVILILLVGCQYTRTNNKINTDSVTEFWEIAEVLRSDSEPGEEQWNSLFNTIGLSTFTSRELPIEWMRSYMTKGIMPSMESERLRWKEAGYYDYKFLIHFAEVVDKKNEIMNFMSEIESYDFLTESLDYMEEYWPENQSYSDSIPMAFLFFDRDARGYDPILFDALYAYDTWDNGSFERLTAHEAHHYCRNKYLSFTPPPDSIPDSKIIWIINQVHAEGIADLIDKPYRFANPVYAKSAKKYFSYLSDTRLHMNSMDSLLNIYSRSGSMEIAKLISRSAPNSGHPMGYYMARTIMDVDGKEILLEDIGNPFDFFRRYNDAARRDNKKYYVFSDTALETIGNLGEVYSR